MIGLSLRISDIVIMQTCNPCRYKTYFSCFPVSFYDRNLGLHRYRDSEPNYTMDQILMFHTHGVLLLVILELRYILLKCMIYDYRECNKTNHALLLTSSLRAFAILRQFKNCTH